MEYQFGVYTKNKFVTSHYHIIYVCKKGFKPKFYRNARFKPSQRDKNGKSLQYKDLEDVWEIKKEYWHGHRKTANKLPKELVAKMIAYSSKKGDLVLDPFLGSAQVAIVAKLMNRRFIGFEKSRKAFLFASKRLRENKYLVR